MVHKATKRHIIIEYLQNHTSLKGDEIMRFDREMELRKVWKRG
jgi:hypothetical protein